MHDEHKPLVSRSPCVIYKCNKKDSVVHTPMVKTDDAMTEN